MLITINHHSGVPVFRQMMDQIKLHIASGLLKPGDELPSTQVLSAQLGLNPMTVSKVYSMLEVEGVVERRRGRPSAVKALKDEEIQPRKIEQLRQSLSEGVALVRQLGIDRAQALEVFRQLLDSPEDSREEG
jgi:GntR family transcriptional regulator